MAEGLSYEGADTRFEGYEQLELSGAKVTALYVDGTQVQQVQAGQSAVVVLDATPFYAESGGQVGDTGLLEADGLRFAVADTLKIQAGVFGHHGVLESGTLSVGDSLLARVDAVRRARTVRNHSATHLMHKALRQVLGAHVQQRGSLVDPDKTRFDFAQDAPLTAEQIARVEAIVNAEILANQPTVAQVMPYDDAVKGGAMALFGENTATPCACWISASRANSAAAPTCPAPATSACSRSCPRAAWPLACAASKPLLATMRSPGCRTRTRC